MSEEWSLMASRNTMLMSFRTGAASWISMRLSRSLLVVDQAAGDGHVAGGRGRGLGFVEDFPKLVLVDEAEVDEHLADLAATAAAGGGVALGRGGFLLRRRGAFAVGGLAGGFAGRG